MPVVVTLLICILQLNLVNTNVECEYFALSLTVSEITDTPCLSVEIGSGQNFTNRLYLEYYTL